MMQLTMFEILVIYPIEGMCLYSTQMMSAPNIIMTLTKWCVVLELLLGWSIPTFHVNTQ